MQELISNISEAIENVIAGTAFLKPELALAIAFVMSIFTGIFQKQTILTWFVVLIGVMVCGIFSLDQFFHPAPHPTFFGMIWPDKQGALIKVLISFSGVLFLIFLKYHAPLWQCRKKLDDLLSILLAIQLGLNLLVISTNWLMVYIAIELVSIGSYVMVGYLGDKKTQAEAALKYMLFGTVCSAVLLYGLSLLYGYTGGLSLTDPTQMERFTHMPAPGMLFVSLLICTGLGFKLSFVPFHFWTPDVYQGAPTPVTAFLSTSPKVAAAAFLGKWVSAWALLPSGFPAIPFSLLAVFAVASMLVGNLAAVRQQHVKRMMAYSSIGHTGFLMMIILADLHMSEHILPFYLLVYVLMNMGVFMLADVMETQLGVVQVGDYRGLGKLYPLILTSMTLLLVSLTGLPPTAGFVAKLLAFSSALNQYQNTGNPFLLALMITGAITTVVSLFFYFKIPLNAFLRQNEQQKRSPLLAKGLVVFGVLLAVLVLLLGIFPSLVLKASL